MTKTEWVAILGTIGGVITALLVSLSGLGEHAPGIVTALLIMTPVLVMNIMLMSQLRARHEDASKRETDYAEALKNDALALQAVTLAVAKLAEEQGLQAILIKWRAESTATALAESTRAIAAALAVQVKEAAEKVAAEVKNGNS